MSLEWPPDEPKWIDVRSMLENGGARFGGGRDFVVCDRPPSRTLAVVGRPPEQLVTQGIGAAAERYEVLSQEENVDYVRELFPDRTPEALEMYALVDEPPPPPRDGPEVRLLSGTDSLEHLPAWLEREMIWARAQFRVFAVFDAGRPVSFAYAHRSTRTYADTSIDTVEAYRRRGYARAACLHLFADVRERGLRPTWGAYASNDASKALAAQLGFQPAGRIYGFRAPATS